MDPDSEPATSMFRPPLARGIKTLDRFLFRKTVPLKAARVFDNTNISKIRSQLERSKDALREERLMDVVPDPDAQRAKEGRKCVLLRPEVPAERKGTINGAPIGTNGEHHVEDLPEIQAPWPHSPTISELVRQELISVIPYNLHLDYSYWTYHDVISSILPLEAHAEIPSGFSQVGHVAHLNLRENYLPYKHLIAEVLLDKNPSVRTVINKIDDVGEENEFRTFKYEVLAGPDHLNVTVSESSCSFSFDYSKVYWNPRLNTEHKRLVDMFKEGEAVCDVMAGIGPFAVPAGKKGAFVWANDLNPDSYASLTDAIKRNKVADFVRPFNADGRKFIREATAQLLDDEKSVEIRKKRSRRDQPSAHGRKDEVVKAIEQPKTFQHFVLNLPASALTFLPSFIRLYTPEMRKKIPDGTKMPLIHVYCFNTKDESSGSDETELSGSDFKATNATIDDVSGAGAVDKICKQISEHLQYDMRPGDIEDEGGVEVYDVRDVAPKKRMFCASFRLPEEVAFRCRLKDATDQ